MNKHHGEPRSAIIVAIGRLEESLRTDNPSWRELEALDAAGPLLATVERRMDLADKLAGDPLYSARIKLIEALICLDRPRASAAAAAPPAEPPREAPHLAENPSLLAAVPGSAPLPPAPPPDDFSRIRAISAEIAGRLVAAGVRHFEDMANWRAADVARISRDLDLGRRIHRENWIEQAALLALQATAAAPVAKSCPTIEPVLASAPASAPAAVEPTNPPAPVAKPERSSAVDEDDGAPVETDTPFAFADVGKGPAAEASNDNAAPAPSAAVERSAPETTERPESPSAADRSEDQEQAPLVLLIARDFERPTCPPPTPTGDAPGPLEAPESAPVEANAAPAGPPAPAPVEVEPAAPAAPAAPIETPKTGLTRLLEARAALRARRGGELAERLARTADAEPQRDDGEDAEIRIVTRKRDASAVIEGAGTVPLRPSPAFVPDESWSGEASVEIVRTRSPREVNGERARLPSSVTPPASPPRGNRFLRALKGD